MRILCLSLVVGLGAAQLFADVAAIRKDLPLSFIYDGKPSAELLPKWSNTRDDNGITWRDPASGLEIRCDLKTFGDKAIDYVVWFKNTGRERHAAARGHSSARHES